MRLSLRPKAAPKAVKYALKPIERKTWSSADDAFLSTNKQRQSMKASFGKMFKRNK